MQSSSDPKMFEERISLAELKVSQGTSTKTFYLQTTLLDNGMSGFKLVLTDGEDVWSGQISENDLDKLNTQLKMDFKKFVTQSVSALTREGLQDITFEYHLKALPSDRMQLVWKKCVPSDNIKCQLGHINLEKQVSPSQSLCSIMSQCVTAISSQRKQIENLEADNERLARDRNSAIKRLDKCVTAKTDIEFDLFSKFVAILNSKKEKIRELEEDRLHGGRNSSPIPGPSTIKNSNQTSSATKRNDQSSGRYESTSHAVDTDEEIEESSSSKRLKPSLNTVNLESSINLGDDDEEDVSAPVARRARRKVPSKKPTISKPILPKVSSTPTSTDRPGSSRKSSLRKSGSGSPKGFVNTEDLLGQM